MKNKIIKYLLSRFTDYYQVKEGNLQLRKANEELINDIKILIEEPNSIKSYIIIETHQIKKNIDKLVWMGDVSPKAFEGLKPFDDIITHETI